MSETSKLANEDNKSVEMNVSLDERKRQVEEKAAKEWESIGICNDFIFGKVMQDKELLSHLIGLILPDLKFTDIEIQAQRSIEIGPDIHGVRFDIFAKLDDGTTVEIEMQVLDTGHLPKRMRYYISMSDMQMLEKGVVYNKLPDSYVIMICPFDYYGMGRHKYTFSNCCKEDNEIEMGDGTTKIVLNAKGTMDDVSEKLKAFLDYVAGESVDDEYVKKLDEAVRKARANKEWRREYMTIMMRDLENQEIGISIGEEREQRNRIATMLRNGKTPQDIADFCGYSLELIQSVENGMLVAQ